MEKIPAEPERAMYALSVAAGLLASAREKADSSEYGESVRMCRDSMRVASSAVLFRDGLVSGDFESSYSYLKKKYGGKIDADKWKEVESLAGNARSLLGFLSAGRKKRDAEKALDDAVDFLRASDSIVMG